MKVFLSWSGKRSEYLAETFKNWLPNVLQFVEPYMSKKDIKLGERWSTNIEDNLREHDFGIVFVTPENINAPWINFEAGALAKNLKSRLIPIIYDSDVTILNEGPLKQFQASKKYEKSDIHDLIIAINSSEIESKQLTVDRVETAFEKWWPDLSECLAKVPELNDAETSKSEETSEKEMLVSIYKQLEALGKESQESNSGNFTPSQFSFDSINMAIQRANSNINRTRGYVGSELLKTDIPDVVKQQSIMNSLNDLDANVSIIRTMVVSLENKIKNQI